ncbi:MAG: tetratricopeptide repeat protein [Planctomycetes bacterium]|nr:tetratricopeptide repeat protein [Planctomycetota bacterium]
MGSAARAARINIKALLVLVLVIGLLGTGVVFAHYVRKGVVAERALTAGNTAFEIGDWGEAARQLKVYLSKYPDDAEVLTTYAEAQLAVEPLQANNIGSAIGAYRRLLRHRPADAAICKKLAKLYYGLHEYGDAAYICRQRLASAPADASAMTWLGKSLAAQRKHDDAREVLVGLIEKHPEEVQAYALLAKLTVERQDVSADQEARDWLDRGVEANPQSAEARVQRARFYRLLWDDQVAANEDLKSAAKLDSSNPGVALAMAEEWVAWREWERAGTTLAQIEHVDPEVLALYDIDENVFQLRRFTVTANLALVGGTAGERIELARNALEKLPERSQLMVLPLAIELLVAGEDVPEARAAVERFRKLVEGRGRVDATTAGQLTLVDAAVTDLEGRPYAVINLLEPLVSVLPQSPNAWRLLGGAYENTGQDIRAATAFEKYARLRPDSAAANLAAARAYVHHNWEKVRVFATQAAQLEPQTSAPMLLRIEATLRLGRAGPSELDGLVAELAELRSATPGNVDVYVLESLAAMVQGKTDDVIVHLQNAIHESDNPLSAYLRLAEVYAQAGRVDEALGVCREAVERHPDLAAPRVALAELESARGQQAEAQETLEQAVKELDTKERFQALHGLIQFLLAEKDSRRAAELLKQLSVDQPDDVYPRVVLLGLPETQQDSAVVEDLIGSIKHIEGERGLQWRMQTAAQRLREGSWRGREDETEDFLQYGVQAVPEQSVPVVLLGRLYELQDRDDRAEELYRQAVTGNAEMVEVFARLLALLVRQQRFADAESVLQQIPVEHRQSREFQGQRAAIAIGMENYSAGIDELERIAASNANDAASRVLLARLLYAKHGDVTRVLALLNEAERIDPNLPTILSSRVSILDREGRDDEAVTALDAAIARRKDFGAYLVRAAYYAEHGDFARAEKDYTKLTTLGESSAGGFLELGKFYLRFGKTQDALTALEDGLQSHPDDLELARVFVQASLATADTAYRDRARATVEHLAQQHAKDPRVLHLQAQLLLSSGEPAEVDLAAETLERVVELDPRNVSAHLQLVGLAQSRQDSATVEDLLTRALGANPQDARLMLARAAFEADQNNLRMARQWAESALASDPRNPAALNLLSDLALREGDVASAQDYIADALKLAPQDEAVQLTAAKTLEATGRRDEGIERLTAYCQSEAGRQSVAASLALAELTRKEGNYKKAEHWIETAEHQAPEDDPRVVQERLNWLAGQGRFDEVADQLSKLEGSEADEVAVLLSGAWLLASAPTDAYLSRAKALFQRAGVLAPGSLDAMLGLAQSAYRLGEITMAEEAYHRALVIAPFHPQALNDLAWIIGVERGSAEEGLAFADKGVAHHPDDPHLLDTRGVLLARLGRLAEARKDLEKCVQLSADLPATQTHGLLHLARICAEQEDRTAAAMRANQALQLDQGAQSLSAAEREEAHQLASFSNR